MKCCLTLFACMISCLPTTADDDHELKTVKEPPKGLSEDIAGKINAEGYRVEGPDGPVCDVWLAKKLEVKAKFTPSLSVNYPFTPGQFFGVLRVPEGSTYSDFRGQELSSGTYTLRYGQQPEDGNHIGTSDLADFLLALPAKIDKSSKTISGFDELSSRSAKSAGATHPAIFSLLPAEDEVEEADLIHDEDYEFWILSFNGAGAKGDKAVKVPVRLVTIGQSE